MIQKFRFGSNENLSVPKLTKTPVSDMEAQVVSLCARVGLPASLVDRALELQRMMAAKGNRLRLKRSKCNHLKITSKGGQGLGAYAQTVVCLHLAANQAGTAVDSKAMAQVE